jgi:hypothetical protein
LRTSAGLYLSGTLSGSWAQSLMVAEIDWLPWFDLLDRGGLVALL